jgi:hypothetical protein
VTTVGSSTPLAETLARVDAREPWLAVRADVPDEPGWHRAADLVGDPGALEAAAAAVAGGFPGAAQAAPGVARTVGAAVLLDWWSWSVAVLGAGALADAGRVPSLAPEDVALRLTDATVTGVAALSPVVHCRPGDPAATDPGARVVGDLERVLVDGLTAHLAPLHAALRAGGSPLLRRGRRALWGHVADGIARALRSQGEQADDLERHLALAARLLALPSPAWGDAAFRRLRDASGREHLTRVRTSCCLYYRLPGAPACLTCPRVGDAERAERLARLDP